MTADPAPPAGSAHISRITRRTWLTEDTFILGIERPREFEFKAGQHIRLCHGQATRDYSLIPGPRHDELMLLIRRMPDGVVSDFLSRRPLDSPSIFRDPKGILFIAPPHGLRSWWPRAPESPLSPPCAYPV
jgi:ferredoxin-NADP reductase